MMPPENQSTKTHKANICKNIVIRTLCLRAFVVSVKYCCGLLILIFSSTVSLAQGLQFVKEKLDFEITESEFTVDGMYYFRNTRADTIKQYMLYPFPENPELGEVTSVVGSSVYPEKDPDVIKHFNQKAAHFRLKVYPDDTAVTHIVYKQEIKENKAEYILASTKAWNRPLEKADFTLKVPINIKIDSLSYNADSLCCYKNYLLYKWYFEDFMPDRNFYVSFSRIKK